MSFSTCEVDPELDKAIKAFKFGGKKRNKLDALIMKIHPPTSTIVMDELMEDTTMDDLMEALPDHQPRFLLVSYEKRHEDGRSSYPLEFYFISPRGTEGGELGMFYAGSKLSLEQLIGCSSSKASLSSPEELLEFLDL